MQRAQHELKEQSDARRELQENLLHKERALASERHSGSTKDMEHEELRKERVVMLEYIQVRTVLYILYMHCHTLAHTTIHYNTLPYTTYTHDLHCAPRNWLRSAPGSRNRWTGRCRAR
jgi:hypothetical protein